MTVFQSLFYWKYHFNILIFILIPPFFRVSILILLEVPLQRSYLPYRSTAAIGFNPYFTGSTTSTLYLMWSYIPCDRFQSLFYWKYHFNMPNSMTKDGSGRSFNPYFTGSTTSTIFGWQITQKLYSFNPYFTGSTTSTRWSWWRVVRNGGFQSLFYWKYHFNFFIQLFCCCRFWVSILILLEVPLQL